VPFDGQKYSMVTYVVFMSQVVSALSWVLFCEV